MDAGVCVCVCVCMCACVHVCMCVCVCVCIEKIMAVCVRVFLYIPPRSLASFSERRTHVRMCVCHIIIHTCHVIIHTCHIIIHICHIGKPSFFGLFPRAAHACTNVCMSHHHTYMSHHHTHMSYWQTLVLWPLSYSGPRMYECVYVCCFLLLKK
jgi:hypothetical protein